jgi:crotonobetainyl-CoA:carnitine CoA-transferase CaiB-like acyl-CoA transferase
MYDMFEGIKVIEVASWTFIPTTGVVLADWGADVIKVEHPTQPDPQRGLTGILALTGGVNPMLEVPNRGKRGVAIDLSTAEGRQLLYRMVEGADVFLTNYLPSVAAKLGIGVEEIRGRNDRIIYGRGTGQGTRGAEAERGGFDMAASWSRGGTGFAMTPPDGEPPYQPGSFGDLSGGLNLAGAVAAALYRRERTGRGAVVDVSLYSTGMWMMGQSIAAAPFGTQIPRYTRLTTNNPLVNFFPTKDARWICLVLLQADRLWPDLAEHLGRPDLADDPRFADSEQRIEHQADFVKTLDGIFRQRTLEEWRTTLMTLKGVWAPVLSPAEIAEDPQCLENGFFVDVSAGESTGYRVVASPAQFDGRPVGDLRRAPCHGEHTEEVLLEYGLDWEAIAELKDRRVII